MLLILSQTVWGLTVRPALSALCEKDDRRLGVGKYRLENFGSRFRVCRIPKYQS